MAPAIADELIVLRKKAIYVIEMARNAMAGQVFSERDLEDACGLIVGVELPVLDGYRDHLDVFESDVAGYLATARGHVARIQSEARHLDMGRHRIDSSARDRLITLETSANRLFAYLQPATVLMWHLAGNEGSPLYMASPKSIDQVFDPYFEEKPGARAAHGE